MRQLEIDSLMSSAVQVVTRDCTVQRVARTMAMHRAPCVLVCDDRVPVGIITECDITRVVADGPDIVGRERVAGDIMWPPLTLPRSASAYEAAALAGGGEARHIVVINPDGSVAGLVTESDVLRAELARPDSALHGGRPLLGSLDVGTRRMMEADLLRQQKLVERHGRVYSVVLLHPDRVDALDDHDLDGDEVLYAIAQVVQDSMRASDRLYDVGGRTLLVHLPETPRAGALRAAHRMRRAVERVALPHRAHGCTTVTASAGVASSEGVEQWRDVVQQAERGLSLARQDGGNAVRAADPTLSVAA